MNVPFLDVGATYTSIRAEVDEAVARVLDSGYFIKGPECDAFEAAFAESAESTFAIGMGSGLDALQIALRAAHIGPGDEVIVPAHTFIATWLAVSLVGATPVPVEVDPVSRNLDPARIAAARTDATKAVIPVHLYGRPADMDAIRAAAPGLFVLADAAQAHGATYGGRRAGALGDVAAFSFYPGKNLGAFGDGGAATTSDPALADAMRRFHNYGSVTKYHHDAKGYNSRLDSLQAAILAVKLRHIDAWNERRRVIAARYLEGMAGLPGITLPPADDDQYVSSWHLFVIETAQREQLQAALADEGVQTGIHYPIPCHLSGAYEEMGLGRGAFPITERLSEQVMSLPIGPHMPDEHVEHVIAAMGRVLG